jgi:hypothetical protein
MDFSSLPFFLGHFPPLIRGDGIPVFDPDRIGCLRQSSAFFSLGD